MNSIQKYDTAQASALQVALIQNTHSVDAFGYFECVGFFYAIACSPELIPPSDWLPVVLGNDELDGAGIDATPELLSGLMALYNEMNRQVQERDISVLPGCTFLDEPLENLEEHAAISQWSKGFITGYTWLGDLWSNYLPEEEDDEMSQEFAAQIMVLSFFADEELASAVHNDVEQDGITLETTVANMQAIFPDAMEGFASIGLTIQEALNNFNSERPEPVRSEKIGRNESCPCGSGKKYKKCCGLH